MKRTLAMVICAVLILSIFPTSVFASSEAGFYVEIDSPEYFASGRSASALEQSVDMQALRTALFNAFYQCEPTVDISSFNIGNTTENVEALKDLIFYEMPDCFHIANYSRWSTASKITKIAPTYTVSKAEYQQMYTQMVSVKDKLLRNIKDNDRLNDVEKALLIHDRLALHCEYDFTISDDNKHNCYGALVNASAVCQGYTEAYDYLLEAVGIESQICISEQLNHSWNIIYIDGVPYHVDVTWDDDAWNNGARGVVGAIGHDNFLRSSAGIYSTGHTANDYDTFPTDTTYDNYFWQKSKSAFQLIDNELYYIDNTDASLKSYSDHRVLCSVSDTWKASSSSYWTDNYARLASNGTELYFSLSKAVYKFDLGQKQQRRYLPPACLPTTAYTALNMQTVIWFAILTVRPHTQIICPPCIKLRSAITPLCREGTNREETSLQMRFLRTSANQAGSIRLQIMPAKRA